MATLVNYTCKGFIKLTPAFSYGNYGKDWTKHKDQSYAYVGPFFTGYKHWYTSTDADVYVVSENQALVVEIMERTGLN